MLVDGKFEIDRSSGTDHFPNANHNIHAGIGQ